jgi:hypothetical protein
MEEVLEWMSRVEQATGKRHLADYEQTLNHFKFNEEMAKWVAQNPIRVTRWSQIWLKMRQIEEKRDQAWEEIYQRDQLRAFLDRHLIRR